MIERAKGFLAQESVVNSYQVARLEEDRSEVFLDCRDEPSAVLIISDEIVTMRGSLEGVQGLLTKHLEEDKEYRFHAVDPHSFKAAKEVVDIEDDRPTWLLIRLYEKAKKPKHDLEPLKKEDASVINEHWGLGSEDSTDYIKKRIEEGPAYGIRKKDELTAWTLTHFITDEAMVLGMLHVKEKWRRKGLAKSLTEGMCEESERQGLIPAVQIFKDNDPSFSLADDLGFEIRAEHHWFGGVKS